MDAAADRAQSVTAEPESQALFISRAGADAAVAAEVGRVLQSAGYGVILQQWDFANRHFLERMHEALASGARVVALLSPDYLRSDHCQAEWMNAIANDPLNRKGRLILLRIVDCEPRGLLAGLAYWDLVPVQDNPQLFAETVCRAVRRDHREPVRIESPDLLDAGLVQHNLPADVKLIGRDADIAQIAELLAHERLVTLVGVGGVGKTSCALKTGAGLLPNFADGVWFVGLAALTDPRLVAAETAAVFQLVESAKRPGIEMLAAHLRAKKVLILLDNCEHVIDACAQLVSALLPACPGVSFLTTSREPLKISGEHVYHLPMLAAPERSAGLTVEDALQYGAIALFVARARAADSRFALTPQNVASVAEICRRLDGIPLALELAAARIRVLAPRQLEQKLDERFRILTGGARNALPRQQTMRALIDWSYDLLDERERALFDALSVFSGSFLLESALAVCVGDEIEDFEVLDGLTSLVDKSLVIADAAEEDTRYRLLESMRQYGRERLDGSGSRDVIARRHAAAYAELAERLDDDYATTGYRARVRAAREVENIRTALTWALGASGDVELGLRLAASLRRIFDASHPAEARRWVGTALEHVTAETPSLVVARLELADAIMASRLNQFNAALAAARRALERFEAVGDGRGIANAKRFAGRSLILLGEVAEGEPLVRSALETYTTLGLGQVGPLLLDLGSARSACGDLVGARELFARALHQFELDRDEAQVAITAGTLAEAEFHGGDAEIAVRHAQAALAAADELKSDAKVWIQSNLAAFLIALDRFDEALTCAHEALRAALVHQSQFWVTVLLQHCSAVLALAPTANRERGIAAREASARLAGYVEKKLGAIEVTRELTEQLEFHRTIAALSGALGRERLERLLEDGAQLKDAQAIDLAFVGPRDTKSSHLATARF